MPDSIYQTFWGSYIDLARIIEISKPFFEDHMGSGGYYIGFFITYQLVENPKPYRWECSHGTKVFDIPDHPTEIKFGSWEHSDWLAPIAMEKMQAKIDEIVTAWKAFKQERTT